MKASQLCLVGVVGVIAIAPVSQIVTERAIVDSTRESATLPLAPRAEAHAELPGRIVPSAPVSFSERAAAVKADDAPQAQGLLTADAAAKADTTQQVDNSPKADIAEKADDAPREEVARPADDPLKVDAAAQADVAPKADAVAAADDAAQSMAARTPDDTPKTDDRVTADASQRIDEPNKADATQKSDDDRKADAALPTEASLPAGAVAQTDDTVTADAAPRTDVAPLAVASLMPQDDLKADAPRTVDDYLAADALEKANETPKADATPKAGDTPRAIAALTPDDMPKADAAPKANDARQSDETLKIDDTLDAEQARLEDDDLSFQDAVTGPDPGLSKQNRPYLAYYAYAEILPAERPADIALASLKNLAVGNPLQEIKRAAEAFGLDYSFMKTVAKIESDFDPKQRTGSYIGLFQLSHYEFQKYGSGDITNPRDNAIAAAYKFVTEGTLFELGTHQNPTFSDLYLIHQQGWQGAAEHVSHPERIAWKSMCATDEGKEKGEKWCKRAVWLNTLPDIKHLWKSVDKLTSAAFVTMWRQRVNRLYARYSDAIFSEAKH
jgi:hypothetical protein